MTQLETRLQELIKAKQDGQARNYYKDIIIADGGSNSISDDQENVTVYRKQRMGAEIYAIFCALWRYSSIQ